MNPSHGVELDALRPGAGQMERPERRRSWTRLAWLLVAAAVIGVAYALAKPLLFPPTPVAAVRPEPLQGEAMATLPAERVEDVGWLEPAPFPTSVRPLVRGVLDKLNVLEGQRVEAGKTVIGTLRNLEIENAHEEAAADLAAKRAKADDAAARLAVAESLLEQKLPLREQVADLEGRVSAAKQTVSAAQARRRTNEATRRTAEVDLDAQRSLVSEGSGTPVALARAERRVAEVTAAGQAIDAEIAVATAELGRLEARLRLAKEGLGDPRALAGDVAIAKAYWKDVVAVADAQEVRLAVAARNLAHLEVKAPIDGIVMRLETAPGAMVGPEGEMREGLEAGPGSTSRLDRMSGAIASLYDPAALQIRVDVLFAKVAAIGKGSKATFTVDAIPGATFHGVVDRFVHEADISQNALQVKVRVTDPDPRMRPEMLCRVSFELPPRPTATPGKDGGATQASFRVPLAALRDGQLTLYDPRGGGRARRVPVEVLRKDDASAIVRGAIGLSSRLILEPVEDGAPVRLRDE